MKVSDLFVECLENEGVKYVFGVPGEENEDLLFSMENSKVRFIAARHELGAAFMADVWGRLTGRAGVCLSTLGPGATNLLTGVADANLDKAPLVAITAQGGISRTHHESHQFLDIVSMFKPVTKWNSAVQTPGAVAEIVRKAFKVAESEKPGATQIELSEEIARMKVSEGLEPLPRIKVRRPSPDYKAVEKVVRMLKSSRRPLILAGNGAIRKLASKHLTTLVEKYEIPVTSTFMGKGAVSVRSEKSLACIGLGFKDFVFEAIEKADLIMTVGYDIAEYPPEKWNPDLSKRIVHIDFTPAEVYSHYYPEVEVEGDISGTLWELDARLENQDLDFDTEWYKPIRSRILEDIESYALRDGDPFTIPGVLHILREIMDDHGLLISDVGSHKIWIARNFPTYCPHGCIMSNGLASMGIALPGAVAASLVDPDRQVVAVMGDCGFMMNVQELETARRTGAGFTAVILNDDDYGLISWKQRMSKGRSFGTKVSNPDFKRLAESFGVKAYRPESVAELKHCLEKAVRSGELCLVDVPIDVSPNDELIKKLDDFWKE
jgi:acetolactate synthase-1/2/3 large subunit